MTGLLIATLVYASLTLPTWADSFGRYLTEFSISFETISANPGVTRSANTNGDSLVTYTPGSGWSDYNDPGVDYRIGVCEVTNRQWNRYVSALGYKPTGTPATAYDSDSSWTGEYQPTAGTSWYEAAQFVNWLNTNTNHHAAYKFTGTQGSAGYEFGLWSTGEAAGGTNLYRHKDAAYFLPSEDEWVKAAYWNGSDIQPYATQAGDTLAQGDGSSGTGWNIYDGGYATDSKEPWEVGSGSEELNGTHDMMGNVSEWVETPVSSNYTTTVPRGMRGGSYSYTDDDLDDSSNRYYFNPYFENISTLGFRVAAKPDNPFASGYQITVSDGDSSGSWGTADTDLRVEFSDVDTEANGALDFTATVTDLTLAQLAELESALGGTPDVKVNWSFTLNRELTDGSTDLFFDLGRTDLTAEDISLWHFNGTTYEEIITGLDNSRISEGLLVANGIVDFSDYTVTTIVVPEPASVLLLVSGIFLITIRRRQ